MKKTAKEWEMWPPRNDLGRDVWWECLKGCGCFFHNRRRRDEHQSACAGQGVDTWL
jgi:hypothetical protein